MKLLPIVAILAASLACNLAGSPASPAPAYTATPAPQLSIPISATPIKLVIPPGLATGASAETIDVVTENTGAPWDVAPAHLQLTLQGYFIQTTFHVPQLFVYPAQQYAGLNESAAETLKRLKAVLAAPGVHYQNEALPRVPFFNAGQVFAAQQKILRFSGGSGVRFVTQYGQDVSPINNGGLFYHFEGLTDDGNYYIVGVLPVNLPFLAADNNPDSPVSSKGIPFPPASSPGSSFEDYFKRVSDLIDAASPDEFSPSLSTLDTLIQSISSP